MRLYKIIHFLFLLFILSCGPENVSYPGELDQMTGELHCEVTSDHEVTISWTANPTALHYVLIKKRLGDGEDEFLWQEQLPATDGTEYKDSGLTVGVEYEYSLKAKADDNDSKSIFETCKTNLYIPENINISVDSDYDFEINWDECNEYECSSSFNACDGPEDVDTCTEDNDECVDSESSCYHSGYNIEFRDSSQEFYHIAQVNSTVTTFTYSDVTDMAPVDNYTFRVNSYTDENVSDYSEDEDWSEIDNPFMSMDDYDAASMIIGEFSNIDIDLLDSAPSGIIYLVESEDLASGLDDVSSVVNDLTITITSDSESNYGNKKITLTANILDKTIERDVFYVAVIPEIGDQHMDEISELSVDIGIPHSLSDPHIEASTTSDCDFLTLTVNSASEQLEIVSGPIQKNVDNCKITINIEDYFVDYSEFEYSFYLDIINIDNTAPDIVEGAEIQDIEAQEDDPVDSVDLSGLFADDDNDPLEYYASSDDDALVTLEVDNDELSITLVPDMHGDATISVYAQDPQGAQSDALSFGIDVASVNDAPYSQEGAEIQDIETQEDDAVDAVDLSGLFADDDNDPLEYYASSDNDALVTLEVDNDELSITLVPDMHGDATISVYAQDPQGAQSDTLSFGIDVASVNDALELIIGDHETPEDQDIQIQAELDDPDSVDSNEFSFEIVSNSNPGLVAVDISDSGLIDCFVINNMNGVSTIEVQVTDNSTGRDITNTSFDLSVLPVNDYPFVVEGATIDNINTIEDDSVVHSINLFPLFGDIDLVFGDQLDTLSYNINIVGDSILTANTEVDESNILTLDLAENQFGTAMLYVTAQDLSLAQSDPLVFVVSLEAVNDAPTSENIEILTSLEDHSIDITLLGFDIENDNLSYSIVLEPTNGTAIINGNVLTYTPSLDYFGGELIQYLSHDENLSSDPANISITVAPDNDAPVITSTAGATATEDVLYTYQVLVDDVDNNTFIYELTGDPVGMVINATGLITWTPGDGVETSGEVTLTVYDGSQGGADTLSDQEQFTITVTQRPDIDPIANDEMEEDGAALQIEISISDDDIGDLSLQLSPDPILNAEESVIAGDLLLVVSDVDYYGPLDITIELYDGDLLVDEEEFSIEVTPVNDAPEITSTAGATATEDVLYTYQVLVDDVDDETFNYALTNQPEGMEVDEAGLVTWTPGDGVLTSGEATLTVYDGSQGGADTLSDQEQFTITVTQRPDIDPIADDEMEEDGVALQIEISISDDDIGDFNLELIPIVNADQSQITNNVLTVTSDLDYYGPLDIIIELYDGDLLVDEEEFSIEVTPVNDAPEITSTAGATATEDVLYTYQVLVDDVDDETFNYALTNQPEGMEVDATGLVTWTPGDGIETSGEVTLTVDDGPQEDGNILSNQEHFTITVTQRPDINPIADDEMEEDGAALQIEISISDDDIGDLSLQLNPDPILNAEESVITGDFLFVIPDDDYHGPLDIIIELYDGDLLVDEEQFTITVTQRPDIDPIADDEMEEDGAALQIEISISDDDIGGLSLQLYPDPILNAEESVITGDLLFVIPDDNYYGPLDIIIVLYDGDLLVDEEEFSIEVTPVNDPPEITSTAGTTATEDVLYEYQVLVDDVDDETFNYALTNQPEGMEVDATGLVTWTPGDGVETSGEVMLTVYDGPQEDGNTLSNQEQFTITVSPQSE